jgi:phage terminase small subunit
MASPRMPANLSSRAKRAWQTAITAVDDPVRYEHICTDYARAITRCDQLQRDWERAGRPTTAAGGSHGHATVPHPTLVAIERAEDHVFKLADSLGLTPSGYRRVKPRLGRPREIVPPLPGAQRLRPVN